MHCKIGDVVTLKSGSPRMTVTKIDHEIVTCTYFRQGEGRTIQTPRTALEKLEEPKKPTFSMKQIMSGFRSR